MKRLIERFVFEGKLYRVRPRTQPIANPLGYNVRFHCFGLLFNPKALWIGAHYSEHHKRLCVNIVPCLTVWWTKPGGYLP